MQWFTTGVSTTLVLILLGIVSFFILFAQRLSDSVKENLTVTVLLDGEASRSDIHEFRPFRYPYDEIGRGELGIYPEAVYGTEFQSRVPVRSVGRCRVVGRRAYPFAVRPFAFPIYPCRYVARRRGGGAVVRPLAYVGLYVRFRQQVLADEGR